MAKNVKVQFSDKEGQQLIKKIRGQHYARVGILGDKDGRNQGQMGNAEIGLIQEFGSISDRIPARSFLTMPLTSKSKDIVKFIQGPKITELIKKGELKTVFKLIGIFCENIIQEAFATRGFGRWAPNSPVTIERKGSSAPLIDTAQLRRSITSDVITGKQK